MRRMNQYCKEKASQFGNTLKRFFVLIRFYSQNGYMWFWLQFLACCICRLCESGMAESLLQLRVESWAATEPFYLHHNQATYLHLLFVFFFIAKKLWEWYRLTKRVFSEQQQKSLIYLKRLNPMSPYKKGRSLSTHQASIFDTKEPFEISQRPPT